MSLLPGGGGSRAIPGSHTPSLLLDLINDPAEPGYAAAAARRARTGGSVHSVRENLIAIFGSMLVGLVLGTAYLHTHRAQPQTVKLHNDLVARVRAAEATNDQLATQLQRTDAQVSALRDGALPNSSTLQSQLRTQRILAGYVAVTGPGLEVTLALATTPSVTPAPRAGVTSVNDIALLTDTDIRAVVNQLWAGGAEAIAVNDVRLTPLCAIRFAGESVLVDFQPITSPYIIRAIGDPDMLVTSFADSAVASRYHTLAQLGGITFGWSQPKTLQIPAGSPVQLRYASAVPSASPTAPATTTPPTTSTSGTSASGTSASSTGAHR